MQEIGGRLSEHISRNRVLAKLRLASASRSRVLADKTSARERHCKRIPCPVPLENRVPDGRRGGATQHDPYSETEEIDSGAKFFDRWKGQWRLSGYLVLRRPWGHRRRPNWHIY